MGSRYNFGFQAAGISLISKECKKVRVKVRVRVRAKARVRARVRVEVSVKVKVRPIAIARKIEKERGYYICLNLDIQ